MAKPMNVTMLFILFLMTGSGCGEPPETDSASHAQTKKVSAPVRPDPAEIIAQAESIYQQAKALEHAWITTSTQLAIARKALNESNRKASLVAAKRALLTAKASLLQAQRESEDWRGRVPEISEPSHPE
jgi:hypothetical protein